MKIEESINSREGSDSYFIHVGQDDKARAASLNLIFDPFSIEFFPFNKIKDGDRILFAGCGNGELVVKIAEKLTNRNIKIVALDRSVKQIECAWECARQHDIDGINWRIGDIHDVDKFIGKFNVVHVRFVLNHLSDAKKVTEKLCDKVAPGGLFIGEELSGLEVDVTPQLPEYVSAIKTWEQCVALQHVKQKSDISFAEQLPRVLKKVGMVVERNIQPNPVATKSIEKNLFPESLKPLQEVLSPIFQTITPELKEKLISMCDDDECTLIFKHFTQIEAKKTFDG